MNVTAKSISERFQKISELKRIVKPYLAEIESLYAEIENITVTQRIETTQETKEKIPINVEFDHQKRTIYCFGKTISFGKKAFLLLQTVYNGENHSADLDEIIEKVWQQEKKNCKIYKKTVQTDEGKKRIKLAKMVSHNTVFTMQRDINRKFSGADVPLKIISENFSKNSNSNEISMLQLVLF